MMHSFRLASEIEVTYVLLYGTPHACHGITDIDRVEYICATYDSLLHRHCLL